MAKKTSIILTAVDFTTYSEDAVRYSCELADEINSKVLILHVIHDPVETPGFYAKKSKPKTFLKTMEQAAHEMMADFIVRMKKQLPNSKAMMEAEPLLVIGTPVTRIIEIAKRKRAKLIVVGSHGRTGLSHLMLGSKAERVVQLSPISVTVVKSSNNNK